MVNHWPRKFYNRTHSLIFKLPEFTFAAHGENLLIPQAIEQVEQGQSLDESQMTSVFDIIMKGEATDKEISGLLTALHEKGESVEELAGAAKAMRWHMDTVQTNRPNVVDTCGTGGGGMHTFNVSTCAAIVAAASGASVAKHGNSKSTSKSGSADVLKELGVNINCSAQVVSKCLNQLGICFCFAPLFHPSVSHVMKVRKKLGFPTIFNLLGPLCNPANAPFQVLGAGRSETREKLAKALALLGTERSIVVHGRDGLGEVTVGGITDVSEVRGRHVTNTELTPEDFKLNQSSTSLLRVQNPQQSADLIQRVLAGQSGPARDIVLANAAAALWISGIADDLRTGTERCAMAIDKGHAKELLSDLADMTHKG